MILSLTEFLQTIIISQTQSRVSWKPAQHSCPSESGTEYTGNLNLQVDFSCSSCLRPFILPLDNDEQNQQPSFMQLDSAPTDV